VNIRRGSARRRRRRITRCLWDERGSTIPLILGFYLIGLMMVGGAVLLSDLFARQRGLQSICDGAAIAASNAIDGPGARTGDIRDALPLRAVQDAVDSYLARDAERAQVRAIADVSGDGGTVRVECLGVAHVAFGVLFGRGSGIEQRAVSSAQGRVE
jgi:hypothetical protein